MKNDRKITSYKDRREMSPVRMADHREGYAHIRGNPGEMPSMQTGSSNQLSPPAGPEEVTTI